MTLGKEIYIERTVFNQNTSKNIFVVLHVIHLPFSDFRVKKIYSTLFLFVFFLHVFRDCDKGTCKDKSNILYAWARNAPPTRLPKGIVLLM